MGTVSVISLCVDLSRWWFKSHEKLFVVDCDQTIYIFDTIADASPWLRKLDPGILVHAFN